MGKRYKKGNHRINNNTQSKDTYYKREQKTSEELNNFEKNYYCNTKKKLNTQEHYNLMYGKKTLIKQYLYSQEVILHKQSFNRRSAYYHLLQRFKLVYTRWKKDTFYAYSIYEFNIHPYLVDKVIARYKEPPYLKLLYDEEFENEYKSIIKESKLSNQFEVHGQKKFSYKIVSKTICEKYVIKLIKFLRIGFSLKYALKHTDIEESDLMHWYWHKKLRFINGDRDELFIEFNELLIRDYFKSVETYNPKDISDLIIKFWFEYFTEFADKSILNQKDLIFVEFNELLIRNYFKSINNIIIISNSIIKFWSCYFDRFADKYPLKYNEQGSDINDYIECPNNPNENLDELYYDTFDRKCQEQISDVNDYIDYPDGPCENLDGVYYDEDYFSE